MIQPATAFRTASFVLTLVLTWLAYPVLAAVAYLGLLLASAAGDLPLGGPFAGPLLVLLAALGGVICVAVAAPGAIAVRAVGAVGALKGVLAGVAVLAFVSFGVTGLAWTVFDLAGSPLTAAAILLAAAAPAALVIALSDTVASLTIRRVRPMPVAGRVAAEV